MDRFFIHSFRSRVGVLANEKEGLGYLGYWDQRSVPVNFDRKMTAGFTRMCAQGMCAYVL